MSDKAMKSSGVRLAGAGGEGDILAAALRQGQQSSFASRSEHTGILFLFLSALGWRGNQRELFEALPHFADDFGSTELRNILATLGYQTRERRLSRMTELDDRLLPCVVQHRDGRLTLVMGRDAVGYIVVNGTDNRAHTVEDLGDLDLAFVPVDSRQDDARNAKKKTESWVGEVFSRFKKPVRRLVLASLVLNLLALITPLFIMVLYDQVIPIRSLDSWAGLSLGVLFTFGIDLLLRYRRARMIAFIGSRIDFHVTLGTFSKLLSLPAGMTESAPLGDQVAKLKDFDSTRDIFTGLLVTVILDFPFVLISLLVMFLIGGSLVLVPLAMMLCYGLVWLLVGRRLKHAMTLAGRAKARRHSFLVETISNLRTIKESAVENIWEGRYRSISADAALAQYKTAQYAFILQTLSQAVMLLSGIATLAVGVDRAIAGDLSVGVLIASMALTWRILMPLQNLFMSLTRAEQIRMALNQIDSLMGLKSEEGRRKQSSGVQRAFQGSVRFNRVSLRYSQNGDPALLGVGFVVKPGEMFAVTGTNGSGKSSILKLMLGLQRPQAGQITLDGIDIRQIAPPELRTAIAYVPQATKLFHGSIAQNLRLSNPAASDERIREACEMAGVLRQIQAMPQGFDTRVGDQKSWQINAGFLQKISLARAYVTDAPILLLDEPAHALDDDGDEHLVAALQALHYKRTIIMVSHRPSHIRIADRALVLNRGTVARIGRPDEVLD